MVKVVKVWVRHRKKPVNVWRKKHNKTSSLSRSDRVFGMWVKVTQLIVISIRLSLSLSLPRRRHFQVLSSPLHSQSTSLCDKGSRWLWDLLVGSIKDFSSFLCKQPRLHCTIHRPDLGIINMRSHLNLLQTLCLSRVYSTISPWKHFMGENNVLSLKWFPQSLPGLWFWLWSITSAY